MNIWQTVRQVKYLLQQATWPDATTTVFATESVRVVAALAPARLSEMRPPIALVRPLGGSADPEADQMDLFQQDIGISLFCGCGGDQVGENAVIGLYQSDLNDPEGRGLLEVEEELLAAVEHLNDLDGIRVEWMASGFVNADEIETLPHLVSREYLFSALVSRAKYYHPVRDFTATAASGSVCTLAWTLPATRFDTRRVLVVRKSGATAPTSITDGTELTLSGDLVSSHTDSCGSGTFSYGVWMVYDEFSASADGQYSDAVTRANVAVS